MVDISLKWKGVVLPQLARGRPRLMWSTRMLVGLFLDCDCVASPSSSDHHLRNHHSHCGIKYCLTYNTAFCISVECLHEEFARAGSDVLQAFTFYANDHLDKVSCLVI